MIIGESSIEMPRCNVVAWSAMVPKHVKSGLRVEGK